MNKKIHWVYPLVGTTEANIQNQEILLKTKCGQEIEQHFDYTITGLDSVDIDDEFNYELVIKHKEK